MRHDRLGRGAPGGPGPRELGPHRPPAAARARERSTALRGSTCAGSTRSCSLSSTWPRSTTRASPSSIRPCGSGRRLLAAQPSSTSSCTATGSPRWASSAMQRPWRRGPELLRIATRPGARADRGGVPLLSRSRRVSPEAVVGSRVIIGQQCKGWPVDHLVVDHLAGLVRVDTGNRDRGVRGSLDPGLRRIEEAGGLIWGWSRRARQREPPRGSWPSPSPSRWPRTGSRRWPVGSRSGYASHSTPGGSGRRPRARGPARPAIDGARSATGTSNADCPQPGITSRPSYPCPVLPRASTASPECRRSRRERHGPSRRSCPPGRTP